MAHHLQMILPVTSLYHEGFPYATIFIDKCGREIGGNPPYRKKIFVFS
jgi:hypothetical protein